MISRMFRAAKEILAHGRRKRARGGGGGASLLTDGWYIQDGDASAKLPVTGQGWNLLPGSPTTLQDNSPNDTISGPISANSGMTVLWVHAGSPSVIAGVTTMVWYNGSLSELYREGDGTSWTTLVPLGGSSIHGAYGPESVAAIIGGGTSKGYHLFYFNESDTSGGFLRITDLRPS